MDGNFVASQTFQIQQNGLAPNFLQSDFDILQQIKSLKFQSNNKFAKDYLECLICRNIALDPWSCNQCRSLICQLCILRHLNGQSRNKCPQRCDLSNPKTHFIKPNIYILEILRVSTFVCDICEKHLEGAFNFRAHQNYCQPNQNTHLFKNGQLIANPMLMKAQVTQETKCQNCSAQIKVGGFHNCISFLSEKLQQLKVLDGKISTQVDEFKKDYNQNLRQIQQRHRFYNEQNKNNLTPEQMISDEFVDYQQHDETDIFVDDIANYQTKLYEEEEKKNDNEEVKNDQEEEQLEEGEIIDKDMIRQQNPDITFIGEIIVQREEKQKQERSRSDNKRSNQEEYKNDKNHHQIWRPKPQQEWQYKPKESSHRQIILNKDAIDNDELQQKFQIKNNERSDRRWGHSERTDDRLNQTQRYHTSRQEHLQYRPKEVKHHEERPKENYFNQNKRQFQENSLQYSSSAPNEQNANQKPKDRFDDYNQDMGYSYPQRRYNNHYYSDRDYQKPFSRNYEQPQYRRKGSSQITNQENKPENQNQ